MRKHSTVDSAWKESTHVVNVVVLAIDESVSCQARFQSSVHSLRIPPSFLDLRVILLRNNAHFIVIITRRRAGGQSFKHGGGVDEVPFLAVSRDGKLSEQLNEFGPNKREVDERRLKLDWTF